MGNLDRIKKRQWDGFKDFVESMELTHPQQRQIILLNGVLEDPIFTQWVMKNIKSFDDFLNLSSDQIEDLVRSNESIPKVMAKALPAKDIEEFQKYAQLCPKSFIKIRDEFGALQAVTQGEREAAHNFLIKTVRKMQREERIEGFRWALPPQEVFYEKPSIKEGRLEIKFPNGTLAAEGEVLKGKRIGKWRHFYDSGRLLGEGEYQAGLKNGKWIFFYSSGSRRSEGAFSNDLRDGLWTEWDRQGESKEVMWQEGKKLEKN